MKLDHFVETQQLDQETIFSLCEDANTHRDTNSQVLAGKLLATLFYEPSTRTRFSFEAAMYRLGGNVITTENAQEFSSAAKGEKLEDTIRVVGGYADGIVLRHFEEGSAARAAKVSGVPIINAGDGAGQHPTQALLDLYTIFRERESVEGMRIGMIGDLANGRTVRSLCYLLAKFSDINITFISPDNVRMRGDIKEYLSRHEVSFSEKGDLNAELPGLDVIYMTRVQRERMAPEAYEQAQGKFVIDEGNLSLVRQDARILHPLPHTEEISLSVEIEQNDPRIAYFRQAENGLYIRQALLHNMLGE